MEAGEGASWRQEIVPRGGREGGGMRPYHRVHLERATATKNARWIIVRSGSLVTMKSTHEHVFYLQTVSKVLSRNTASTATLAPRLIHLLRERVGVPETLVLAGVRIRRRHLCRRCQPVGSLLG